MRKLIVNSSLLFTALQANVLVGGIGKLVEKEEKPLTTIELTRSDTISYEIGQMASGILVLKDQLEKQRCHDVIGSGAAGLTTELYAGRQKLPSNIIMGNR